jgi:hypothetical protein
MTRSLRPIDRFAFDIDHGVSNAPPPRPTDTKQNGTAYVWNSTTQELLPILPPDHPDYRENAALLVAAFRRWNGGTSR